MVGGRIYSKGDLVSSQDLKVMKYALRSGAVRPVPKELLESQIESDKMVTLDQTHRPR